MNLVFTKIHHPAVERDRQEAALFCFLRASRFGSPSLLLRWATHPRYPRGKQEHEELDTQASITIEKSNSWDWKWPAIAGVIIVKLFGPVGGLVTIGAYFGSGQDLELGAQLLRRVYLAS